MRSIVDFAVRRRVTVVMTAIAVAAFGFVGYSRLTVELFPDISYPSVTIQTDFPDTAPEEVENLVTRPIEEAVGVLRGLRTVHSVSRPGSSEVTLEFDWDSDMDLLSMEVREKLDRIREVLPEESESPVVLRFDPSLDPIMRLALSGDEDLTRMRLFADRKLKQDLEKIKGVAAAQIRGGLEEEIQINVDQERLAALKIPIDRVRQVVGVSNINRPGGILRGKEDQFLIRTLNEFQDVEEIRGLIISYIDGASVRLDEVAEVKRGAREREEITRVDGKESVEVSIFKEGDANTVAVAHAVAQNLATWQKPGKLRQGYSLDVLFDQSGFIEQALLGVRDSALIGGVLAILVLFAFLRDFSSTVIIATSIPVSVVATFLVMYRSDISLNIMSLGGLTLGIGMLVDSSIVVLESIHRRKQLGDGPVRAAIEGTTEVGAAVMASTLTTVAVFLPIVFVEGVAGQLFRDQALTVTISLLASLVVAVTMIPMLSALGRQKASATLGSSNFDTRGEFSLGFFSKIYDAFIRGALKLRWLTIAAAVGVFMFSVAGLNQVGTELIPRLSEGEFYFEVILPEGSSLAATDRMIARLETAAQKDAIGSSYATIGSRLVSGGMSLNTKAENFGQINILMKDRLNRELEDATAADLRDEFADVPDLELKHGRPSYFSLKTPIEVVIYGEDLEELRALSLELANDLSAVTGLVDIRSSLEAGNPELQISFDRRQLAALNLDVRSLSETLRSRVQGVVATQFKEPDRQIDIRVRNFEHQRSSVADIKNLIVPSQDGRSIRLSSLADIELARGPAEIHRLDQQRAAVITADVKGRSLGAVIADVESFLEERQSSLSTTLGGQNQEMKVSFESLKFAITLAIFLVYLVMASTFESFLHPLIVLFTIPLSLVGVVVGLLATNTTISVIVLIGSVMLVGIVVNNAIVLIDTINRLRRAGVEKYEAVVRAGHIRLRPILMTTITTVLGLLPMALSGGEGAELRTPLAITVASGLIFSTLLTLVVIPAVYMAVPSSAPDDLEGDE